MKKLLFLASIFALSITTLSSCTSDDDSSIMKDKYIKNKMIGKWQYSGFYTIHWITDNTVDRYYIFNKNNTYVFNTGFKSKPIEQGRYEIISGSSNSNPVIKTISNDGKYKRELTIVRLYENIAELQQKYSLERFEKQ